MRAASVLTTCLATITVAGGTVVVLGMSSGGATTSSPHRTSPTATRSTADDPVLADGALVLPTSTPTASTPTPTSPATTAPRRTTAAPPLAAPVSTAAPARRVPVAAPTSTARRATAPRTTAPSKAAPPKAAPKPAAPKGQSLPLGYSTGSATRVLTVTASSTSSTTATLQPWIKAAGGGWTKVGTPIAAHIGSQGMTTSPSESKSATPMGSFSLTQAFGHNSNPGTPLPYFTTTSADYWMSDTSGSHASLYNTHQRCPSSNTACYNDGTNERLYYETPYYNYAVVIDYNTRNSATGVRPGKGSAFFLHVTDGRSTAGCVAIPQTRLVSVMKWLAPSAHPRILIGRA